MPLVTCSNLRQIIRSLLQDLSKGEDHNDPMLRQFVVPVSKCDSIEDLVDACLHYVEPEILGLEGKALSPET